MWTHTVTLALLLVLAAQATPLLSVSEWFPSADPELAMGYAIFAGIEGTYSTVDLGFEMAYLGDINGDGLDDAAFSEHRLYPGPTRALVVFGADDTPAMSDVTAGSDPNGFFITFAEEDDGYVSMSLSGGGDYNDDGINDILVGNFYYSDGGGVAVIFGRDHGNWTDIVFSSDMSADIGVYLHTQNLNERLAYTMDHIGDFNGDGVDDFVVTATKGWVSSSVNGAAYIVFGGPDLASGQLNNTNSLVLMGEASGDTFGYLSATAGDFNNDSLADVVITAPYYDSDTVDNVGRVYVIFGQEAYGPGELLMSEFQSNDTSGFTMDGPGSANFPTDVSGGCDINNDTYDDLLVGVKNDGDGYVIVLLGKATGFEDYVNISDLSTDQGYKISGGGGGYNSVGSKVGCLGFVDDDDMYADFYIAHEDSSDESGVTVFRGGPGREDLTLVGEEANTDEIAGPRLVINGGTFRGASNISLIMSDYAYRGKGSIYVFESFPPVIITDSPTLSPTTSPTVSPTTSPTTSPTGMPSTSPTLNPSVNPTITVTSIPTESPSVYPSMSPTVSPTTSPTVSPTMSPTNGPTSTPTTSPTTAPTLSQCDISISTTGGDGLTWDITDDEGDEEIASGEFGGEAMDFTLLASEEYLLFLSSDTVPAGTSITVTINGQVTVIPLEQGLTTSTEIAGVTCEAISNKIASIDSAYSSTSSALLALLMVLL